jgi:hypothetical protein
VGDEARLVLAPGPAAGRPLSWCLPLPWYLPLPGCLVVVVVCCDGTDEDGLDEPGLPRGRRTYLGGPDRYEVTELACPLVLGRPAVPGGPDGIEGTGTTPGCVFTDCPAGAADGAIVPGRDEVGATLAAASAPLVGTLCPFNRSKAPKPRKPSTTAPATRYSTMRSKTLVRLRIGMSCSRPDTADHLRHNTYGRPTQLRSSREACEHRCCALDAMCYTHLC